MISGSPTNVTLTIVREQGSTGAVAVYYQTKPALSQAPDNQAVAGQDYAAKDGTVIMAEGTPVVIVTIAILPVRSLAPAKTSRFQRVTERREGSRSTSVPPCGWLKGYPRVPLKRESFTRYFANPNLPATSDGEQTSWLGAFSLPPVEIHKPAL